MEKMSTNRAKDVKKAAGHKKHQPLQDDGALELFLLSWGYRLTLIALMAAGIFFGPMLPEAFPSGCRWYALGGYAAIFLIMQDIYHACQIGQFRVSELILCQALANLFSSALLYLGVALYNHRLFNPLMLLSVFAGQMLLGIAWTLLSNRLYFLHRRRPRTMILSRNEDAVEQLYHSPYFHTKYDIIGVFPPAEDPQALREQISSCEAVFVVDVPTALCNTIAKLCVEMDVKGYFTPRLGQIIMAGAQHWVNFSLPLLRVRRADGHGEYRFFKRAFDIACALAGLILCSPVILAVIIAIRLDDHGPIFYRQVRLTRNGREFNILKFRSMSVNAEADGVARLAGQNDSRITRVGKFIRACRIDELPQLINILMGDMSIVGPRPERPEIAAQYEQTLPEFALRLQVKAGLTGLAQIYGRYNTEPYHKLQMDLMYINEMSFIKDLQLILATIKILFVKDSTQGVEQGSQTAQRSASKPDSLSF